VSLGIALLLARVGAAQAKRTKQLAKKLRDMEKNHSLNLRLILGEIFI
jgi:hypothetical protein